MFRQFEVMFFMQSALVADSDMLYSSVIIIRFFMFYNTNVTIPLSKEQQGSKFHVDLNFIISMLIYLS